MNHGLMTGMLWGGMLVAAVPTLLLIGVCVYIVRVQRAQRRQDAAAGTPSKEVSP